MLTLGVSQVRQNLPKLINEIDARFERLFITKGGKAKAVLMSAEEFESWIETFASYADPQTLKIHKEVKSAKSVKDIKNRMSLEELKKKLKIE